MGNTKTAGCLSCASLWMVNEEPPYLAVQSHGVDWRSPMALRMHWDMERREVQKILGRPENAIS